MARFVAVKFKRVAAAFDEVAKARLCESSGSEYSPASFTDLSGLVNSFLEKDGDFVKKRENDDQDYEKAEFEVNDCFDEVEIKENLRNLMNIGDDLKRNVFEAVENALVEENDRSSPEFKRRLMVRLRDRGFDAGLCKSKWEKSGNSIWGTYSYIDVNFAGNRYIIEVSLAGEFEIARAMPCYESLLQVFPKIFVGKVEDLRKVVKIMSRGMRKSMKKMDIYVPPWRRLAYMEAKWFGSYKRTTNDELNSNDKNKRNNFDFNSKNRAVGFVPMPTISFYCTENNIFPSNNAIKMGNLAAALNG